MINLLGERLSTAVVEKAKFNYTFIIGGRVFSQISYTNDAHIAFSCIAVYVNYLLNYTSCKNVTDEVSL